MKTYKTSEVAKIVGLHPNTIRRYEEWELIPIPPRAENGYRVFTDYHIETIKIAQIAFQIEVLQSGLRMTMVEMVKAVARYDFEKAQSLLEDYLGNWERNGLLAIKRRKNNYRTYDTEDIKRLKIIRTLRSAKYSLAAILRMLNAIDQEKQDIKSLLNPVDPDESILTACDNLIDSLEKAKSNACELKELVKKLQQRFFKNN